MEVRCLAAEDDTELDIRSHLILHKNVEQQ